jgi:hypothetical protein
MKLVNANELAIAYTALYPEELESPNNTREECFEQIENILDRWIKRYVENPTKVISNSNWNEKVTSALFVALRITKPKTVKNMLSVLETLESR